MAGIQGRVVEVRPDHDCARTAPIRIDRPARDTTSVVTTTSTANAMMRTSRLPGPPSDAEKNTDSSRIAEKSATVAATIAVWPTSPSD